MAVQLGLSAAIDHGLELRTGPDRRQRDRRAHSRGTPDRRRHDRRRRTLRSLLFTTLTLGLPHQVNPALFVLPLPPALKQITPTAVVTTTIDSFVAVPPWRAYNELVREAGERYNVDPLLIRSVMQIESAFNPLAVSRAGALGLMQLMPEVAADYGVEDPFDPRDNIMAGARYLRRLLDLHRGDLSLALASYNAGPGVVARYGAVPPFPETQAYVDKVTGLLEKHSIAHRYASRAL